MTSLQRVTAVVGASGGLGASTLTLAIGRRLAATGPPAVVVDLDLLRGGLEVTAGVEHLPGRRWDDLRHVQGRVPADGLVSVLPGEEGCAVLSARGGAPPGVPETAARDVVASLTQGSARVVLDLPLSSPVLPGVSSSGALVVLVIGLRTRALADADAAVSRLLDGRGLAARDLVEQLVGLGPVAALAADTSVTDLLVNGDGVVWVDRGHGVERAAVRVAHDDLRPLAVRLAGVAGRRLDDAQPWVDGLLPGGVRLHAVLPPLADGGPHLSLRFARHRPGGVEALVGLGAVSPAMATLLREVVAARVSLVVTGGTGAGKTTVLAALLAECPPDERVVVVEDVRELDPDHPHVVRLQGRGPNVEGVGGVTLVDLVRQALRMRPDRLVVGEVRGAEVRELLAALNTGHEGGMSTLHANGPEEAPARFEALGALAGMPRDAVHAQLREALRVVVHVVRRGGSRCVERVGVVVPDPADARVVRVVEAARSGEAGLVAGPGRDRLLRLVPSVGTACRWLGPC